MKNPVYEQVLNAQGVPWCYLERLELAAVDRIRSLANQARLEQAVDPDLVTAYRERYRKGDQFPPLVVSRTGKKRYIILDGNQRFAACSPVPGWKGLLFHDAYQVDTNDEIILNRIAWSFNNHVNGRRLSFEESLQHAVTFVRKYQWTCAAAAGEFSVPVKAVHRVVHIEDSKDKLHQQKVKKLPSDNVIEYLSPLTSLGDDVFAEAATVVADSGASGCDVKDLIKKVKRAKTHADKLAVIGEFESSDHIQARRAETKGGTVKPRSPMPKERLKRLQTELRNLLEDHIRTKAILLPSQKGELDSAVDLASDLVRLLSNLYGSRILTAKEAV